MMLTRLIVAATYTNRFPSATRRGPLMNWSLPDWLPQATPTVLKAVLLVLFVAWWLWGVNWRKAWPVLAEGGWVPLVLAGIMAAFVWSRISPSTAILFNLVAIPNLLWQLGTVGLLIGLILFCGWLQTRYGWYPSEVSLEPPPPRHGHDAGHDHHASHDAH
jgi:hypothetical protein